MPDADSIVTASKLAELEAIIQRGKQTFFEVGNALAQIMEEQLYKEKGFGSFAEYCETVWGFKKTYAYQLVQSAELVKELPATVSAIAEKMNPAQVRELVKIPKEKRETVIKNAVAKSKSARRKMTAKDIKTAASPEPAEPARAQSYTPEPITAVVVAPEPKSIEIQLHELWNQATATERENFLTWIKNQPVEENPARFKCDSCEAEFDDDGEAVTLYECNDCGTRFTRETSANYNHSCPDCNKFGSKVTDCGCPECNEGELVNQEDQRHE